MRCPNCGGQLDEDNYCSDCIEFFDENDYDDSSDYFDENDYGDSSDYFDGIDEEDYDSRVNNGEEICLNCTYWSVSPYGAAHGMVCRRGYPTDGPGDSCSDFVQEHHFANYGDAGQYQFDETDREISNKLRYWRNGK